MSNIPIVQKEAPRETQMRCIMQTPSTRTNDLSVIRLVLARKKWIVDCSWLDLMGSQQQGIVDSAELFSLLDLTISAKVFALKYSAHHPRPRRGHCRVFELVFIFTFTFAIPNAGNDKLYSKFQFREKRLPSLRIKLKCLLRQKGTERAVIQRRFALKLFPHYEWEVQ